MKLPHPLSETLAPLFEKLPLDAAMPELLPKQPISDELVALVEELTGLPSIKANPTLAAGLWLYVDDLHRSHELSQQILTSEGSLWHGIMHRREGDFWNSKYWFRKAGDSAGLSVATASIFVDRVEKATPAQVPALLTEQRAEWQKLFEWCAKETQS